MSSRDGEQEQGQELPIAMPIAIRYGGLGLHDDGHRSSPHAADKDTNGRRCVERDFTGGSTRWLGAGSGCSARLLAVRNLPAPRDHSGTVPGFPACLFRAQMGTRDSVAVAVGAWGALSFMVSLEQMNLEHIHYELKI